MTRSNARPPERPYRSAVPQIEVLIDLEQVEQERRAQIWTQWVPEAFDGVEVQAMGRSPAGLVRRLSVGPAYIWQILSSSQTLLCRLPPTDLARIRSGLIIQLDGSNIVSQSGRLCRLLESDICLIDGSKSFQVEAIGVSRCLLFQFPHYLAEANFPELLRCTAQRLGHGGGEAALLRGFVEVILDTAGALTIEGSNAAVGAVLKLIGSLAAPEPAAPVRFVWRIRKAIGDIEALLDDNVLCPNLLASRQGISRRRLDALFVEHTGLTLAAQIQERRLTQAAVQLCPEAGDRRTITEVAYAAGFKDTAHFTRAFRRRFGQPPSQWRRKVLPSRPSVADDM